MIATLGRRIAAAARAPNPVMLKELRQFVRSRALIGLLLLLLLALVSAIGFYALAEGVNQALGGGPKGDGANLFAILLGILFYGCLLVVPIWCAARFAAERSPTGLDLLHTTALTPGAIVRGKLYAGAVYALFIYGVAAPFLALTYLLRGIDLPTILFYTLASYFVVVLATQGAIFFGALPMSKVFRILVGVIIGLQTLFALPGILIGVLTEGDLGAADAKTWRGLLVALPFGLAAMALLQAAAAALIMPPAANRARPVRTTLAVIWALSGAAALLRGAIASDSDSLAAWLIFSAVAVIGMLLLAVGERTTPGPRIRESLPRHRLRRLLALPFTSGEIGGLLWALAVAALTPIVGLAGTAIVSNGPPRLDQQYLEFLGTLGIMALYVVGYALTVSFIHSRFSKFRWPRRLNGLLAVGLITIVGAVLSILGAVREDATGVPMAQPMNIFVSGQTRFRTQYFAVAGIFAALAVALNLPRLVRQWKAYRSDAPADSASVAPPAPPPLPPARNSGGAPG